MHAHDAMHDARIRKNKMRLHCPPKIALRVESHWSSLWDLMLNMMAVVGLKICGSPSTIM
jgi:hypothetical protein